MLVDSHIHTEFSTDSKMVVTDAIERARKMGIGLTLTEHTDLGYPEEGKFIFEPKDYFARYGDLRSPNLRLGVEIGMQTEYTD
ncbi:MAG: PHP domain-containing protein, partial [Selenomonadales bacterium]|nr:PHP domain-containing protein [Selenomonadales bacterium]